MGFRQSIKMEPPAKVNKHLHGFSAMHAAAQADAASNKLNDDRFRSSYAATFMGPKNNAGGNIMSNPNMGRPTNVLKQMSDARPMPFATLVQSRSDPGLRSKTEHLPPISPVGASMAASKRYPSSSMVVPPSPARSSRGSGSHRSDKSDMLNTAELEHARNNTLKRRDAWRSVMELLSDPGLKEQAQQFFNERDPDHDGKLDIHDLMSILDTLNEMYEVVELDKTAAERLFKKYDVGCDGKLHFDEFFQLVISLLRESAFDPRFVMGRSFFVTKQKDNVWDTFEKLKQLGAGTFGTAHLAKNRFTGEERVVKTVKKSRVQLPVEEVECEIMVMQQIDHPHIVRLFRWFEDAGNIYLVMEALKGGTLKNVIIEFQKNRRGIKEGWIRTVVTQVARGLAYVHSLRLIHKDLKDENIMLLKKDPNFNEPFAVIIDLGIAEMFSSADPVGKQVGGTPLTMAPEVWDGSFGPKCDVWSLGCVLYEMLTGTMPFVANQLRPDVWKRLHRKGPDWTLIKTSPQGKSSCREMLTYDERQRPTMAEVLKHEWFQTQDHHMRHVTPGQLMPLQSFSRDSTLKRTLLLEIASKLPMDQSRNIVNVFESFDVDCDGKITKEELKTGLKTLGMDDPTLAERTFNALDVDKDGSLTFTELASGVLLIFNDILDERLQIMFEANDVDEDGFLNMAECKSFLQGIQKVINKDNHNADQETRFILDDVSRRLEKKIAYADLKKLLMGFD